ncbi:MAG: hypothetical protein ABID54_06690 [Pseudomonadota bacterium]
MKFQRYFQTATLVELDCSALGLHGMVPDVRNPEICKSLLIALCDREGFVVVLGIADAIDFYKRHLSLYSPPFDTAEITSIQFGSLYLDTAGRQLARRL